MLPTLRSLPAAAALCCLLFSGCAKTVTPIHPGAVNQFDSQTYDALITIQAGIEQAKADVETKFPQARPALNSVIAAYNVALQSYKTYHAAASTGKLPDASELIRQVQAVQSAFSAILTQIRPISEARPAGAVFTSSWKSEQFWSARVRSTRSAPLSLDEGLRLVDDVRPFQVVTASGTWTVLSDGRLRNNKGGDVITCCEVGHIAAAAK